MNNMSDQFEKKAYIRYNKHLGELFEVSLNENFTDSEQYATLEVLMPVTIDFLTGKKKLDDFIIDNDDEGNPTLSPKIRKVVTPTRYSELYNIISESSPFDLIELTANNFTIKLKKNIFTEDITLIYLTEKNDPNCLVKIIKFQKSKFGLKPATFEVNHTDEYSLFVRHHAT